jgi:hypothetical protein
MYLRKSARRANSEAKKCPRFVPAYTMLTLSVLWRKERAVTGTLTLVGCGRCVVSVVLVLS